MLWKNRRQSSNVVDRRGAAPYGIGTLVIGAIIYTLMGGNPMEYVAMNADHIQQRQTVAPGNSEEKQFVSVVLADTEDVWNDIFRKKGLQYKEPKLVLFNGAVNSACGRAGSAVGPFYCPGDQQVYLDLGFFKQLSGSLGATGDFASAYVVAHEVGHHVQHELGVIKGERLSNRESVKVELMADCLAGIWARHTEDKNYMEEGDLREALTAASAVGDDKLQQASRGEVVPDSFTHGSSAQRMAAFERGFERGELRDCVKEFEM